MISKIELKKTGFTLIELIASVAILGLIMIGVSAVLNQTSRAWLQSENRAETFQNARLALDMIGRELEGAIVQTNPIAQTSIRFKAIEGTTDADITASGGNQFAALNSSVGTNSSDQIFFVAPGSDSQTDDIIDLHEYGYFVLFATNDAVSVKGQRYYLMRMDNDENSTGFDVFTASNWYETPNDFSNFANTFKPPFIDNVIQFELNYSDASGTNITQWTSTTNLPHSVSITLTALDRRAAERLAAVRPSGLNQDEILKIPDDIGMINTNVAGGTAVKQILTESSRTFYKKVNLINAR